MKNDYLIQLTAFEKFKNNAGKNNILYKNVGIDTNYVIITTDALPAQIAKCLEYTGTIAYTGLYEDVGVYDLISKWHKSPFLCIIDDEDVSENDDKLNDFYKALDYCLSIDDIFDTEEILNKKKQNFINKNNQQIPPLKTELEKQLSLFFTQMSYIKFEKYLNTNVLGQECINDIAFIVYEYIKSIYDSYSNPQTFIKNHNFLIAGPSGSGKTHLYRTLENILQTCKIYNLPIIQIDMSSITQEGFKGKNMSYIQKTIFDACTNLHSDSAAIVFLDEFDKKLMPNFDANGVNMNAYIQGEMLTLLDGIKQNGIDTGRMLFIGVGTFQTFRDKRKDKKAIGFESLNENNDKNSELLYEDLFKIGAIPELVGRFTGGLYNFKPMTRDNIKKIITDYAMNITSDKPVTVTFSETGIDEFAKLAGTEIGCRIFKREVVRTINPILRKILIFNNNNENVYNYNIEIDGIGVTKVTKHSKIKTHNN